MKTNKTKIAPEYGLLTLAMELRDRLADWDRQDEELQDALSSLDASERDTNAEENTRLAILAKRSAVIAELVSKEMTEFNRIIPPDGDKGERSLCIEHIINAINVPPPQAKRPMAEQWGPAAVQIDWHNDRLQFLVLDHRSDDVAVFVRISPTDGRVAEIVVADDLLKLVRAESGPTSEWQKERDADTRGEGEGDTPEPEISDQHPCTECGASTEHYAICSHSKPS